MLYLQASQLWWFNFAFYIGALIGRGWNAGVHIYLVVSSRRHLQSFLHAAGLVPPSESKYRMDAGGGPARESEPLVAAASSSHASSKEEHMRGTCE